MILGAAIAGPASAAQVFVAIDPCRIFDTRAGDAPAVPNDPTLATTRTVTIQGNANCPDVPATGVTAVVGNVIAVQASSPGFLTIFPQDVGFQGASHINFPAAVDASHFATDNGGILPLDADPSNGDLGLAWDTTPTSPAGSHTVHVVIDVTGYFVESAGAGLLFNKGAVYEVSVASGPIADGASGSASASCNDSTDVAIEFVCEPNPNSDLIVTNEAIANWAGTVAAASVSCDFQNVPGGDTNNGNGHAIIYCLPAD